MHKLDFKPNVSVGPFVFGMEQTEVWKMIKREFGSERNGIVERDPPAYETEFYDIPYVYLDYKESKLISVCFIDDIGQRDCEIYLGKEKIWPRTKKKFFSIFGADNFVEAEIIEAYYHPEFSLCPDWDENPPSLLIAQKGYCIELIENWRLFNLVYSLKGGTPRSECRMLINRTPQVSDDGRTDNYPFGEIKPEVMSFTYDENDRLIKTSQTFPNGEVLDFPK